MKYVLAPVVALVFVMMSYGGAAGVDPYTSSSAATADDANAADTPEPGAPGPYTGPADIPQEMKDAGWKSWSNDEFNQCGDVKLVFLNSDLQEDENGFVHAQGTFFIQFQAVNTGGADHEITRFSFSFGKGDQALDDNPTLNCNESLPDTQLGKGTAGAYLLFYRSDFTAEDGFFVPIETRNVPDGEYAAAIHAYTGDSITGYTEVGRGWTFAVVDNCVGQSLPNSCPNDSAEDQNAKDRTLPWPIVLPGDGVQTNDVQGLTVEFPEAMDTETVKAFINNEEVPLSEWTPPPRDVDVVPLNDETDCPANVRSVCETKVYGPGFKWEGPIPDDAIVRVEGADLAGNLLTKQMHLGSGVLGGTVSLQTPEIDFSVRSPDTEVIPAGEEHQFLMRLDNIGGAEAHVNLLLEFNETHIDANWEAVENDHGHADKTHVVIAAGEQTELNVKVTTNDDAPKATYPIKAILEYPVAGETVVKSRELFLTVDNVITQEELDALNNQTEEAPAVEESPGIGIALVATGVLGTLAVVLRRRE